MSVSSSDGHDPRLVYGALRAELVAALRAVDESEAKTRVPACPQWRVTDVVAHVSGLVAEVLAGVEPPLGSDEATARQVRDRQGLALADILDEWESNAPAIFEALDERRDYAEALVADLVIHTFDIHEVVELGTGAAAAATPRAAAQYVPRVQQRAFDELDISLSVELDGDRGRQPPGGTVTLELQTTSHLFLRSVTGRRRRSEVESLEWFGDPTELLDRAWNQYGDFRR